VGTRTTITTRILALAALLMLPALATGAGLGRLALHSALGDQLKADIDIVSVQRGEAGSLSARIASPDTFRQAGVDYGAAISSLRASVQNRNGEYYVVLTSTQPINEPFLDVLVELNWATGRLVRQYTFLLDPAEYKGPTAAAPAVTAVESKPVEPPKAPEPAPAPAPAPAPSATTEPAPTPITPAPAAQAPTEPAPAPAPMPEKTAAPAPMPGAVGAGGTYEVMKGDTLSHIAVANLPDGVSLNQMLVALYRANESAFINNNMNLVREGAKLTIPGKEDALNVARADATQVVAVQEQEFDAYRGRVASAVAMAPAREAPSQRATGVIEPAQPAPPAPKPPAEDQLRLSRAESAGKAGKSAASADDLAARERDLREQRERVGQLEQNVKDMERLLELKNQQLAELQKQASAAAAPPPAAKAPPPAARAPEPAKAPAPVAAPEPAKPAPPPPAMAKAPEPAPAPEAPKPAEPMPEPAAKAPEPAKAPEAAKAPEPVSEPVPPIAKAPERAKAAPPKPRPRPVAPPPPPETSLVDDVLGSVSGITDNPVALGGIGGVVVLLLGYGVYAYRKKKASSLENSLAGVTTTDSSSVFGTTGGRSVDTGGSSLQTDFSQSGIGAIDTDEVDPVAEADVYMAYGRDAQAEEILKEALQKDPSRQAVRVKLLEIYAARKDVKAFETTAGEIYAATGGQGPDWEKTAQLGQQIDPNNALYGGRRTEPSAGAGGGGMPPPPPPPPQQREPTVTMSAPVAAALATPEVSSPRAAPPSIDFNIEASSQEPQGMPDIALDLNTPSQAPSEVGFDLNLGEPSQAPADQESDFSPSGTLIMDAGVSKAAQDLSEGNVDMAIDFELPQNKESAELTNTARMMAQSQPTVVLPQSPVAKSQPTNTMDFDFKLDEPTQDPKGQASSDISGISLDLGSTPGEGGGEQPGAGWQEVATKLDLAKAYEEMGDKDGARELLNEVMKEGDAAQQQKAKSMLDALV